MKNHILHLPCIILCTRCRLCQKGAQLSPDQYQIHDIWQTLASGAAQWHPTLLSFFTLEPSQGSFCFYPYFTFPDPHGDFISK